MTVGSLHERLKKMERRRAPARQNDRQAMIRAAFDRLTKEQFRELANGDHAYTDGRISAADYTEVCRRLLGLAVYIPDNGRGDAV